MPVEVSSHSASALRPITVADPAVWGGQTEADGPTVWDSSPRLGLSTVVGWRRQPSALPGRQGGMSVLWRGILLAAVVAVGGGVAPPAACAATNVAPSHPSDEAAPSSGIVEVIGYTSATLFRGSAGPVRVRLGGEAASRLRQAFDALLPLKGPAVCMESEGTYTIDFIPKGHSKPTVSASGESCPSPGFLRVTSHGQRMPVLEADCALAQAVVAALPQGRASFTRQNAHVVCRQH